MAATKKSEPPEGGAAKGGSPSEGDKTVPAVVNGRFEVKQKLGSGSYSDVYLAWDKVEAENVAVKFEWTKAERGQRLLQEAQLYESLAGTEDAPRVRWWGVEGDFNCMALDLLGPSLEDLFCACGRRFSLKTVLLLVEQMIDRVRYVHSRGILHRDIKPNNFLMGLGERSRHVYIMDFGLAKRYLDPAGEHIPCVRKRGLTGTVRYTSLNVHRGLEPSRRDDLGAIGYVMMYFSRGRLPWQGISAKSKRTKQRKIGGRKEQVSHRELCQGYPEEFVKYLEHCDSLPYPQAPDYDYLKRLLRDVILREQLARDWVFDWMLPPRPQPAAQPAPQKRPREIEPAAAEAEPDEPSRKRRREPAKEGEATPPPEQDDEYDSEYDESEEEEETEEDEESEYEYASEEEPEEEKEGDEGVATSAQAGDRKDEK